MNADWVRLLRDGMFLVRLKGRTLRVKGSQVRYESHLEDTIAANPLLLGMPLLIVWRQVRWRSGRIDLFALDVNAAIHVIELKRGETGAGVLRQILAYDDLVSTMTVTDLATRFARYHRGRKLADAFRDFFRVELPPTFCERPVLTIVAASIDATTEAGVRSLRAHGYRFRLLRYSYLADVGLVVISPDVDDYGSPSGGLVEAHPLGSAPVLYAPFVANAHVQHRPRRRRDSYVDEQLTPFWSAFEPVFDCDFLPSGFLRGLYRHWLGYEPAAGALGSEASRLVFGTRMAKVVRSSGGWRHHRRRIGALTYPREDLLMLADWTIPKPDMSITGFVRKELF